MLDFLIRLQMFFKVQDEERRLFHLSSLLLPLRHAKAPQKKNQVSTFTVGLVIISVTLPKFLLSPYLYLVMRF